MYDEMELFVDALDDYMKAKKDRDNDIDGNIGDDSVTWKALAFAKKALRDRFKRAVLSVLGN